ncbi:hypothetical protein FB451DRAFT_1189481 [Mycena latifolia]|nr:hypothetical protein FB451DRAFT_1189481 [Mycena latifolia]
MSLPDDPYDLLPLQREPVPHLLPAATAYGTVQSGLALVCAQEYPWVHVALNNISEIVWGPHLDERREYLFDLQPDQLVFLAVLAEMTSLEPDFALFFDSAIADFTNAWVDHFSRIPRSGKYLEECWRREGLIFCGLIPAEASIGEKLQSARRQPANYESCHACISGKIPRGPDLELSADTLATGTHDIQTLSTIRASLTQRVTEHWRSVDLKEVNEEDRGLAAKSSPWIRIVWVLLVALADGGFGRWWRCNFSWGVHAAQDYYQPIGTVL